MHCILLFVIQNTFQTLSPMMPYGLQTMTGSSGQDPVQAGTFWVVLDVSLCHPLSVIRRLWSVFRRPSIAIRHPSSVIRHLQSVVRHLSSVICHQSSVIRRQSSVMSFVIRHPSSVIQHPSSGTFLSLLGSPNWLEVMIFCDRQFLVTNGGFQLTF